MSLPTASPTRSTDFPIRPLRRSGAVTVSEAAISSSGMEQAAQTRPPGGFLRRVAAYGLSRGTTELLLALRSILLAALLGPAAFGSWALLRLGMRYTLLAGLGVFRGLELELLHADARETGRPQDLPAATALGFILLVGGTLSALAIALSFGINDSHDRLLLRGFAVASLAELVYGYAMVYTRVRTDLRRFAILETSIAALHIVLAVSLARVWGLAGALGGLATANLIGIAVAARWVTFRPALAMGPLRRLLEVGLPVTLTSCVGILLVTSDRWVVTFWGGPVMLGYYAFGASATAGATALALVIRTVVVRQVYGETFSAGAATALRAHLERVLLPFARLLPPALGAMALIVGPLVALILPGYTEAIGPARLFLLAGAAIGLVNLAAMGAVAAGQQRRLPVYAGSALALTVGLSILALMVEAGLEGVAAAAFAGHFLYAAGVLRLIAREAGIPHAGRFVLRTLLPLAWCALAVGVASRLASDHSIGSTLVGLGVFLLLMLPQGTGWRSEWRKLRH
jgi:O-antigen/teichoic acid export membrane protein